jgi:hypothetical protein
MGAFLLTEFWDIFLTIIYTIDEPVVKEEG